MPTSYTMHTTNSQESLTSNMARTTLRPVKHVRFASKHSVETRSSLSASDPFSESYKDWSPDGPTEPAMYQGSGSTRGSSEDRHSSTRHTVPSGSSRRESVEGFDDIKRRWSIESLSEMAYAVDDE